MIVASEIDRACPSGTLPRRMDVLSEVEAEQFGQCFFAVGDRPPGDRKLAGPAVFRSRGVTDAGAFEGLPRVGVDARIALALDPVPGRRLADNVQDGPEGIVVEDLLYQDLAQVFAPRAA